MNRILRWVRRTPEPKPTTAYRMHSFRPQLEQLDERLLPSLSSAISIQHSWWNFKTQQLISWTERDWYTTDRSTGDLIEYQGTTRYDLGTPAAEDRYGIWVDLSASVDPKSGFGEVFVLEHDAGSGTTFSRLWLFDSSGQSHILTDRGFAYAMSATRDGHVYYCDGGNVLYEDSNGNYTDLGVPGVGVAVGPNNGWNTNVDTVAASQWSGGNEVFVIGGDGYIYLNTGTPGQWTLIDNSAKFVTLSATPNNTVFAVTSDGRLFQETEHFGKIGQIYYDYWAARDISGGLRYTALSADSDASGNDEVYAIQQGTNNASLYDRGSWTIVDTSVYDIAAAGGGYFYDVNYDNGNYSAWLYQPNGNPYWTFLGDKLN